MLPAATPDKYPARSSCSPLLRQAGTVYRMEDGDRRFSEQEVDAILSHAVELEKAGLPQQGLERSLTLSELRDVAREAGTARRADRLATELASAAEELGSTGSASDYDTTSQSNW